MSMPDGLADDADTTGVVELADATELL